MNKVLLKSVVALGMLHAAERAATAKPPPPPPCNPAANGIAYINSNVTGNIYTMGWDGSCKTLVYSGAAIYPSWSLDGASLAFHDASGPAGNGVYTIPATGGSSTLITSKVNTFPARSAWSPGPTLTGYEMIAFTDQGPTGLFDVLVVRPDGTGRRTLTDGALDNFDPSWSRFGDKIAVEREGDVVVYRLALNVSGELVIASTEEISNLACSPLYNATFVGFPSFARTSDDLLLFATINGVRDVWRVSSDRCNPTRLTDSAAEGSGYARAACWKADDSQFVHEGPKTKNSGVEIAWRRNADGSNRTALGNTSQSNYGCRP